MRSRRQTDNEQPRLRIAKVGNRSAPVLPVLKRPSPGLGHLPTIRAQPRTPLTRDDLLIQFVPFHPVRILSKMWSDRNGCSSEVFLEGCIPCGRIVRRCFGSMEFWSRPDADQGEHAFAA